MRQVQPETLPKNSIFCPVYKISSPAYNIKNFTKISILQQAGVDSLCIRLQFIGTIVAKTQNGMHCIQQMVLISRNLAQSLKNLQLTVKMRPEMPGKHSNYCLPHYYVPKHPMISKRLILFPQNVQLIPQTLSTF